METDETPATPGPPRQDPPRPPRALRLPSARATAALAAVMLGIGVAVGAAIGPAPQDSFAGGADSIAQRLPLLLAEIAGREKPATSAPAATAPVEPPAAGARRKRQRRATSAAASTATSTASTTNTTAGSSEPSSTTAPSTTGSSHKSKLPAITSVWLIELAGGTFSQALAKPSAAPYTDATAVPAGTLLSGWSALAGSTFAGDAALAAPSAAGSPPPLLHSIVQPPCPEGAAGVACAPESAGQLTAADEFLKATLAQITTTASYREHGLVVVTFTTVGIAAQGGLPAGASTATLTSQPPAGVLLMSPFARAGARATTSFNPTSPSQSLEALLH